MHQKELDPGEVNSIFGPFKVNVVHAKYNWFFKGI